MHSIIRPSLLFAGFFFCSLLAFTQVLTSMDVDAIKAVMAMQEDAWNQADIDAFMEGYWKSDSLLFIGSSGPTYGWQATYDRYKRVYPDKKAMGILSFTILHLRPLGKNHARLIGKFHLKREIGDLEGYFTLLWEKMEGKWLIISDHTS